MLTNLLETEYQFNFFQEKHCPDEQPHATKWSLFGLSLHPDRSAAETNVLKVVLSMPVSVDPFRGKASTCPWRVDQAMVQAQQDNLDLWSPQSLQAGPRRRGRREKHRRTSTGAGWCPWPRCRTCSRSWLGSPEKRVFYFRACANSIKTSDQAGLKECVFPINKNGTFVYQIYYCSNEEKKPAFGEFTPEQLENHPFYKFKNKNKRVYSHKQTF